MNAKRAVWVMAAMALLALGSPRSSHAQLFGGFSTFTPGYNALGGINQFGAPGFANAGFGATGYGAVSNFNSMTFGSSPYSVYGGSPYGVYGGSPYNGGSPYGVYGGSPYGYRNYNAYASPYGYGYGTLLPSSPIYVAPPRVINQTNSLMGAIRFNTGQRNWRRSR